MIDKPHHRARAAMPDLTDGERTWICAALLSYRNQGAWPPEAIEYMDNLMEKVDPATADRTKQGDS